MPLSDHFDLSAHTNQDVIGGLFGGIRVTEKEEVEGLDIGEHGMEAYPDFVSSGR